MRDSDDRDVPLEFGTERRLNDRVGLIVDRRRRLVEQQQLALAHDRPRQRDDLFVYEKPPRRRMKEGKRT
jgi:hypothetical protein